MIHRELSKKMKINRTTKWYMNKPESFLENEALNRHGFWYTNRSPNPEPDSQIEW